MRFTQVVGIACLLSRVAVVASEENRKNLRRAVAATTPYSKIVTIGDSFSSGMGIHRNSSSYDDKEGDSNPTYNGVSYNLTAVQDETVCGRELDTTPGPKLAKANGAESILLACNGAELRELMNQFDYLNALYPGDKLRNWTGSIIILTAGANDIRTKNGQFFGELLFSCIFQRKCNKKDENQITNLATVQSNLMAAYTKLISEATEATIRILGYPKLMQRDPCCLSVKGVSRKEADWIDERVDDLNKIIADAVDGIKASYPKVDIAFVDVYDYLTTGACGLFPNKRHVNKLVTWKSQISASSFHPTQRGYDAYYRALLDSL